jgi:putative ABC transport system permease protein
MKISFWALGWRSLWRDMRAGDLRLLIVAVTLAVAALTAVGFFADRLQGGLQRDARQLLGGDAVVASDAPTPPTFLSQAKSLGLQTASTYTFPTMARAEEAQGGAIKLVALKSVEAGYPLRGNLRINNDTPTRQIPQSGEAWVDSTVLEALNLRVGDAILLGRSRFTIAALITQEPDRGAGLSSFTPRVMLNEKDIPATGLVQPASRVQYRFAVAGDEAAVQQFQRFIETAQKTETLRGLRLESLDTGRPEMSQTLGRAEKFLNLVALLAALLSAVAVALAARAFAAQHLDDCAMLRVLGLPQRTIAAAYAWEFGLVGMLASSMGTALGYAVHYLFVWLLAGLVAVDLPAASLSPVLSGWAMGLTLLFTFGLPPVLQLAQVPPLRVIRRDVGRLKNTSLGVLGVGLLGFAALLMLISRDWKLGLITVGGVGAAVLVFALVAWGAVRLLRRAVNEANSHQFPRWAVFASRQVYARPAYTVVQISALAIGLFALVLLVLLRTDLVSSWRNATPPDAPNRFVINIQPDQADAFRQTLKDAGVARFDWFPMVRGRLVAVNGRAVSPQDYTDNQAKRLVDREFNLSFNATLPEQNTITAGAWKPEQPNASNKTISIEEGLAKTLQLKLGDTLRFEIGGMPHESTITSLRKVDWGSMRVNFFALYPVNAMPDVPYTLISAYRAPKVAGFDNALVRQFPNITNVDTTATVAQVQRVLEQVIRAVEFLFGFTLAAGVVVLFAAVTATREERAREYAILRAIGAGSQLLRQVQRAELVGVGLLAGLLASLAAMGVGWALAHYVFVFEWTPALWIPLGGALAGALLAWAAGWWGLREVLNRPVVQTLRRAAS